MTATRGQWIRFLLAGLSIAAAPFGLPAGRAQGFGPDPFKPYNSQYDQFVYPISPLGGGAAAAGRAMGRNDNQFSQYLNELEGADRASSQRYGIGMPYWKARTNADVDRRESRFNRRADRHTADSLGSITQKYLAYFSEDDPRKRAILMREFTPTRSETALDRSAKLLDETADRGAASGLDADRRPLRGLRGPSAVGGRLGAPSSPRRSAGSSDEKRTGSIPPPPPLSRSSSGSSKTGRRPTDVLKRSQRLDDDMLDSGRPASATRRRLQNHPAPSPADSDE